MLPSGREKILTLVQKIPLTKFLTQ